MHVMTDIASCVVHSRVALRFNNTTAQEVKEVQCCAAAIAVGSVEGVDVFYKRQQRSVEQKRFNSQTIMLSEC